MVTARTATAVETLSLCHFDGKNVALFRISALGFVLFGELSVVITDDSSVACNREA